MKINLKHITIISGLALAVGCGGDDDKPKNNDLSAGDGSAVQHDLSGDQGPNITNPDMTGATCSQTYDPNGTLNQVGLQTISPEAAWVANYPFVGGVTVTWYDMCNAPTAVSGPGDPTTNTMATITLPADVGQTVRPEIVSDATYLPSISDPQPVASSALTNIPDHMWLKADLTTGPNAGVAVTNLLTGVGGPTQTALLAQGACIFEALTSHDPQPVVDKATITVAESGFDIYSIHGSDTMEAPAGTITVKKDNDGGLSGRFLITKNGNTDVTAVTIQATDKGGVLHYNTHSCSIIPGYIVFEPTVHDS